MDIEISRCERCDEAPAFVDIEVVGAHTVCLTDDECNLIRAILYGGVGGPERGRLGRPRRLAGSLVKKIPWPDPNAYSAKVKVVNHFGGMAVVVTDNRAPRVEEADRREVP